MFTNKLVLMRHGESQWNKENRFTGWVDIDLSDKGRIEAKQAGQLLKLEKFFFDFSYTSVLKRAIHTLWIILDELNQSWLPVEKSWRLNERHYGILQGLNKNETIKKYGNKQIKEWRRGFSNAPPALNLDDAKTSSWYDMRYSTLKSNEIPSTESLELTVKRILPYWNQNILPRIKNNEKVIIIAHGNSIRAIMKIIDNINEQEILKINIPTSIPLVYEFDKNINSINHYYLGDSKEIMKKITEISNQCEVI